MKELKPQSNRIRITDIRKAIAKECLFYNDTSKRRISEITRAYLKQLKKDGYRVEQLKTSERTNATRVNYIIDQL